MNEEKLSKKQRIDSLQAIRAFAFLGICTFHCGIGQLGAWGVSVFFILSGFVMMYNYQDRDLDSSLVGSLKFSLKKIKKLYPLHILMMLTALFFVVSELSEDFSLKSLIFQTGKVVLNIFLLQTWVPSSGVYFSLNGVAWYLSASFFLYAMFPTILKRVRKMSFKSLIIAVFTVYILQITAGFFSKYVYIPGVHFKNFSKWVIYILPLFRLGDFLIGCFVGKLYFEKPITVNKSYTASLIEVGTIAMICLAEWIYSNQIGVLGSEWFRHTMLFTPSSICLILIFTVNKGFISKASLIKPILHIGNISAYTFLIHQMVIRYLDVFLPKMSDTVSWLWIKMLIVLFITVIASEAYIAIEKRLLKKKKPE